MWGRRRHGLNLGPPIDVHSYGAEPVHEGTLTLLFRGRDPDDGRPVGIRRARPGAAGAVECLAAAWQVRRVLGSRPDVADVLAVGGEGADATLVSAWYPDTLISAALPAHVVAAGAVLAEALSAFHAAGLVHRDVRAGTVFVDQAGRPVLGGLHAATVDDGSASGGVAGPLHPETAPEVLQGEGATPAADVYGLGAVLHHAVTGFPLVMPIPGETEAALALRMLRRGARPPGGQGLPPALDDLIAACVDPEPYRRPPAAPLARRLLEMAAWMAAEEQRRAHPTRGADPPERAPSRHVLPVRPGAAARRSDLPVDPDPARGPGMPHP